ncbi:unnamed protein product [Brassica napus]|uniref:(rape) hypothetical protein n=1 Tax=Brassica napus TaxID=3708 RepID=A0A816J278_BRANA|nr:unnamed protein product [Brassica napus]
MAISFMVTCHLKQPYASASPTPHDKGRACRYTGQAVVVVLDERGRDVDSEQMAELLGDAGNSGASRISFCIGGAYGHGSEVRKRANVTIRLSSMVLNHQIALVVLMEQLYRAWTILKGQNYHH